MMIENKKSQHEIAGFAIIVVVVSIVGLAFLSLAFRPGQKSTQTSAEISDLLEASMYYTTDCAVSYYPQFKEEQELVKSCYRNRQEGCLDGRKYCDVLNSTLKKIISNSLVVGEKYPNKAYRIKIYYSRINSSVSQGDNQRNYFIPDITEGNFGNCSAIIGGGYPLPVLESSGEINIELEVCKNKGAG